MDGNRRFAKRLMLQPWKGHENGSKKVEKIVDWCLELGIKEVTLYTMSVENFNSRPKEEFNYLIKLFKEGFKRIKDDPKIHEKGVKVNFIGRTKMFDDELQNLMTNLMDETKENSNLQVNFAIAYGGRTEIVDATKKIAEKVKSGTMNVNDINEDIFENHLYIKSNPELIIRTGGDIRTSNFLPYQSTYSEWFFIKKLFPDFEKEDLVECIESFVSRNRRFGK